MIKNWNLYKKTMDLCISISELRHEYRDPVDLDKAITHWYNHTEITDAEKLAVAAYSFPAYTHRNYEIAKECWERDFETKY